MNDFDYEHFFNTSTDMLALLDAGGYIKRVNDAFENSFYWSNQYLVDRAAWRLAHNDDQKHVRNSFRNLAQGHPVIFAESKFINANGEKLALRWSAYPDPKSELIYFVARNTTKEAIKDSSFKFALESSPTCIFIIQEDGRISYTNQLGLRTFDYTEAEINGQTIEVLIPDNIRTVHVKDRSAYNKNPTPRPMGTKRLDLIAQKKDGTTFPVDVGLSPVRTQNGNVVICSLIDISLRVKKDQVFQNMIDSLKLEIAALDKLASTDELTQIPNRRAFLKQTQLQLYISHTNKTPISLAILDIDDFKSFNDAFGHLEGDHTLNIFGKILKGGVRNKDFPARYGGEEFAILMPASNQQEAFVLARRLKDKIENFDWPRYKITASFGLATYHPRPGSLPAKEFITQIIMLADEALYHSKNQGKNRITHINSLQPDHYFAITEDAD